MNEFDWPSVRFSDLLEGGTRNGIYKKKEFHGSGVKVVNMGELFGHPRLFSVPMKRLELTEKELKKSQLAPGDLLFARRSLTAEGAGKCSIVMDVDEPTVFESSIIRARLDPGRSDSLFYYYFFNSPQGKSALESIRRQVAVAGITGGDLVELEVPAPPLDIQWGVSGTLGLLDEKIELNHQTVRTLEELAQRLFKSWFVDFDPVRAKMAGRQPAHTHPGIADLFPDRLVDSPLGPIPEGWEFRPLADFADFVNGKNFTKNASGDGRMVIRIAELNSGPGARTVWNDADADEKYIAEPGSILFAWSGSLGVYRWYRDPALINQHIFKVIPHDGISKAFCFQAVQHLIEEFRQIAAAKAVTMGHIKRSDLKEHGLHIPSDSRLVAAFSEIASPMWDRALLLEQESETLAQLRDRLLPKLISGEIRVPARTTEMEDVL